MGKFYIVLGIMLCGLSGRSQVVNIPDANFKARLLGTAPDGSNVFASNGVNQIIIDVNSDGEIQQTEALNIIELHINADAAMNCTGLEAFSNLNGLYISGSSPLSNIDVSTMSNLNYFNSMGTSLGSLDFSANSALTYLDVHVSTLSSLVLPLTSALTYLDVRNTQLTALDMTNQHVLDHFECGGTNISSMELNVGTMSILNISVNDNLVSLKITATALPSFDIGNPNLANVEIHCGAFAENVTLMGNNLQTVDFSGSDFNGHSAGISSDMLTNVNFSNCQNLVSINLQSIIGGPDGSLDLTGVTSLQSITYYLPGTLSIPPMSGLTNLEASLISELIIGDSPSLTTVGIDSAQLQELNLSQAESLVTVGVSSCPQLHHVILKNGSIENSIGFAQCPLLQSVCVDEAQIDQVTLSLGNPLISVNSYCSVEPGGAFNRIYGSAIYDWQSDGCGNDVPHSYVKMVMNDGTEDYVDFTDSAGEYKFYPGAGNFTVSPELENPAYYTVSPVSAAVNFPVVDGTISTNDFCITQNGIHPDLEVVVSPWSVPIPGFDATYQVTLRNKGNQIMSQPLGLSCTYDLAQMDYISTSPPADGFGTGIIYWNYTNLMPFETRTFYCTVNIHQPTDTYPVNSGDVIQVSAGVPSVGDVLPSDNNFILEQTAVNSFDPNDILCLEGDSQPTSQIGEYLHYRIRFENTGTAPAQNVVVRLPLNPAQYEVNSLQLLSASHPVRGRVHGNVAEFIFENVNIDSGGHGNVLLKVRSSNVLQQGDSAVNGAGIYFDYNFPVETEDAETVFEDLSATDNAKLQMKLYPNPVQEKLSLQSDSELKKIEIYDASGRLVEVQNAALGQTEFSVKSLQSGVYLIKVNTQKGSKTLKFIKQ
ncbi:T9SS type A sorting domain-containing protein [Flavobacterium silvaticum]|uniref:T9SS type A sorting domain-containing protein n=1 Tax=Flavobacterium silvaticum TaxID=1852020 RepID=A0A972FPP1_9FLAO|nr:T9SS type A sorting domain-containing protein [Flavobacterium silvaticum]NMH29552.1 T9SS type A sorting domain-containing protein [Flavobacterium silvaticum]